MSWTYDSTSLATDTARVRLMIGDTNTDDQLLTDEEIAYMLTVAPSVIEAAARCVDAIIARLARDTARSAIGMSDSIGEALHTYRELRDRLRQEHSLVAEIASGADTVSGKETLTEDTDRVQPLFRRAQFSNNTADDGDTD